MKTDEDIYASLHNIYHLADNNEFLLKTAIGWNCYATALPIRNIHSKYYTSMHSYPQRQYPGYCSGGGYISSMDVIIIIIIVMVIFKCYFSGELIALT